jgi:phosphoglycolate phosphatase-like HAD superfamily hydrolase
MRFEAVVFDFDGTLVDSAAAKRAAFFDLFPNEPIYRQVVTEVLDARPDDSRFEVIPEMIARLAAARIPIGDPADRIDAYGRLALQKTHAAPEAAGASALLRDLHEQASLYVASNTPEAALQELVEARGWTPWLQGVFGYPRDKTQVVGEVVGRHGGLAERIAVVGDAELDEIAARRNGCVFFRLRHPDDLRGAGEELLADVRG